MNDFMLGAAVRAQAELSSYGGGTVTEATPPRIVGSVRDGVKKFTGYLTGNANLKLALIVLGGCIIFICVGLLAARKWWPNTPIGRSMQRQGRLVPRGHRPRRRPHRPGPGRPVHRGHSRLPRADRDGHHRQDIQLQHGGLRPCCST